MKPKIQLLSEQTINQIAAGEVIENPASLIKELVENALDAGARKIVIEVLGGGLQKVKVSDDGSGMDPEDALLCLQRHATSKIGKAEDLLDVTTMGFRGEALASIAAVSKMSLQTMGPSGQGTEVHIEGGCITQVIPCARTQGTTIEVRNIFYNVPARKKFQKSPSSCLADITKACVSLSLAYPFIAFELYQQEQELVNLPKETGPFLEALHKRAKKVLGEDFSENAFPIDIAVPPFSLKGILGSFQKSRASRSGQHQFINSRAVLCPMLSYAVKEALGTRIEEGKFPIYVLHLEIPTRFVDVNVHPQKKEVRLLEEKWMREQIQDHIRKAFINQERPLSYEPVAAHTFSDTRMFAQMPGEIKGKADFEQSFSFPPAAIEEAFLLPISVETRPEVVGLYGHFLWVDAKTVTFLKKEDAISQEGLLFIDLQAASLRVLYDSLSESSAPKQQMLLFPFSLTGSIDELKEISLSLEELSSIGFSLREARNGFLVESIPASLEEKEAEKFLRDYLFAEDRASFLRRKNEKKLANACLRAVSNKADAYSAEGAVALLQDLLQTTSPFTCPFGEKIITFLGKDDLQQIFSGRRK
jgi:DNA mismatch repair protein MutL